MGGLPERPAALAAIEAELERRGWLGYERREAPAAGGQALRAVHDAGYLEAVRQACERGGSAGPETPVGAGSWEAAERATGGACALVEALLTAGAGVGCSAG